MLSDINAEADALALDSRDPLSSFRDQFVHDDDGIIYLDGNSLGRPPIAVTEAINDVVNTQWPKSLIGGWDRWIDAPSEVGNQLAVEALGARPGEVLISDSTSVNLFKLASAALNACEPSRTVLITDDDNFPTDRYILQGLAQRHGARVVTINSDPNTGIDPAAVAAAVGEDTAVVCLSHVAYRSGAIADMASITEIVHEAGAFMLWDLCHSVGAVPIELSRLGVDLAVGCTYKHLNAGPGAPAFLYVRRDLQNQLQQPIWGWFSQHNQFDMAEQYEPVDGIGRFAVGTPPVIGVAAVGAAVEVVAEAGLAAIRKKSLRLGAYAQALCQERLSPLSFTLASPHDPLVRGGHLTISHPQAWQISQAMRTRNVFPDYREPNRIRLGFAPLYNSYQEVSRAIDEIASIVKSGAQLRHEPTPGRVR